MCLSLQTKLRLITWTFLVVQTIVVATYVNIILTHDIPVLYMILLGILVMVILGFTSAWQDDCKAHFRRALRDDEVTVIRIDKPQGE